MRRADGFWKFNTSLLKCKIQKNWCTVTVAPTIEHHGGHSRTPAKPEARPGARDESASPAWLAAPAMNARDTTKCIYGGLTLDVDRHYIGSVTSTTHQKKGIITLESNQTNPMLKRLNMSFKILNETMCFNLTLKILAILYWRSISRAITYEN